MTLNITTVSPWGVWQCTDARLVNPRTGNIEDDFSMKHLTLHCRDGHALISYSGIGSINGRHVSSWLREMLRGESRTLVETFTLIRDNATRWIGPHVQGRYQHVFNIGVFSEGSAWLVQIGNVWKDGAFAKKPRRVFESSVRRVDKGIEGSIGGVRSAIAQADLDRLWRVLSKSQNIRLADIHGLFASINRRASSRGVPYISPNCITSFMPPTGMPTNSILHGGERCDRYRDRQRRRDRNYVSADLRAARRAALPHLYYGIDLTEISQALMDLEGKPIETRNELLDGLMNEPNRRAVTPRE